MVAQFELSDIMDGDIQFIKLETTDDNFVTSEASVMLTADNIITEDEIQ